MKRLWSKPGEPAQTISKPDLHKKGYFIRLVGLQENCILGALTT